MYYLEILHAVFYPLFISICELQDDWQNESEYKIKLDSGWVDNVWLNRKQPLGREKGGGGWIGGGKRVVGLARDGGFRWKVQISHETFSKTNHPVHLGETLCVLLSHKTMSHLL